MGTDYDVIIAAYLDNVTYGLAALLAAIAAVPTASEIQTEIEENAASLLDTIRDDLANGTDGLGALKILIDQANTYADLIDDGTNGLAAIKAEVEGLAGSAMVGTNNAATAASAARILCQLDFWSDLVEEVAVTGAQSTIAITGGNVVVADLPAGATIVRAIAIMKFRMVENTNGAANKLDAASALPMQVDDDGDTGWLTCIDFVDDAFGLAASTREGGDVIIGDIDIAARVDGNDTYDFQWLNAKADQANLQFNDVQMGLRIWYSI